MLKLLRHVIAIVCIFCWIAVGVAEPTSAPKALRPLVLFVGADTRIAKHQCLRIATKEAWIKFWLEHAGKSGSPETYDKYRPSGAPEIDFSQCMVVTITESPGIANAGIVAVSISEAAEEITFDYDNMLYQFQEGNNAPGNAYGYFVLKLSPKRLVLRHNIQDYHSRIRKEPPVWKEVTRFEALK